MKANNKKIQSSTFALLNLVLFFSTTNKAFSQNKAGIAGVDHVGINVPNLKEAINFFNNVLDFTPVTQIGPIPLDDNWKKLNHINLDTGDLTIKMLHAGTGASIEVFEYANSKGNPKYPNTDDIGASHVAFYTPDINASIKYLKNKGVKILGEPFTTPSGDTAGETWVYFETPWGSKMELVSYPKGKGYEKKNPEKILWSPKDIYTNNSSNTDISAKDLLLTYLNNINDADKIIDLFAEDATIELPYLKSLGLQWQWHGKDVIYKFLKNLPNTFKGFEFDNIQIHIETPEQVFGEYDAHSKVSATGRDYDQTYMGRLVAENGKIKLLREALNMAEVAKSSFPNGINDLNKK
jgi:catechol 2,3-dioxygenase-like lactoylglutathione lyase family enzyme/ketosteroid isomerase-like protein